MQKTIVFAALAMSVSLALADSVTNSVPFDFKKKPVTEEERLARKAYVEKRMLEHTGGKIVRPGTKMGEIVYVNCQNRAERTLLDESAAYFTEQAKFNISVKDGSFDFRNPQIQGNASLFVIDDESLPPILVAPESRWAMVNVAPLAKGAGEKPAFFQARVKKELTRGFAMLCGASNSGYPDALTGGISNTAQLDKFADARLPVDVIARFAPYMQPFGATPAVITTYRKACKEGWAPAPTNDYQKAIFEQVANEKSETLKGPTNPRKITFDPKKGE